MRAVILPVFELRTSPHVHTARSVDMIMRHVVYSLLPLCAYGVWLFGISALALLLTTTATCLVVEHAVCRISGRTTTVGDYSVVITGLLLGLTLPPGLPLWMAAVGSMIAVAPGKLLFGGLGHNVFNPALVGRAFLQAAFPVAITTYTPALARDRFVEFVPSTWTIPFMKAAALGDWIDRARVDAFSGATPLMLRKFDHVDTDLLTLFLGVRAGSIGESAAPLLILCGLYLILRKMMDWRIPTGMIGTALFASYAFHVVDPAHNPDPLFVLFTGGLVLGAMFMATDPVASPATPAGMWIYGAFMGLTTVIIRIFGGLPEGVMYAILLGNALSPLIDDLTQPRAYGHRRRMAVATGDRK